MATDDGGFPGFLPLDANAEALTLINMMREPAFPGLVSDSCLDQQASGEASWWQMQGSPTGSFHPMCGGSWPCMCSNEQAANQDGRTVSSPSFDDEINAILVEIRDRGPQDVGYRNLFSTTFTRAGVAVLFVNGRLELTVAFAP
jgi:hypothetical protein